MYFVVNKLMYPECAQGTKHPLSFAVSVPQIAPFSI